MNTSPSLNRQWIVVARPSPGPLRPDCLKFEEQVPIPSLKDGEFLVQNLMFSFDPSQRFWMERDTYMPAIPLGEAMKGLGIGRVLESKNPKYPQGARVSGFFAWQDYSVCSGSGTFPVSKVPENVSDEMALSLFGMTGMTAFFGMEDIGKVQPGEYVVVSGASGATGSVAAQIAKIRGAKVIGIAGGEKKCQWLLEKAGLYAAIDYKKGDVARRLKEVAPKGIDVYFDNVGGKILDAVLGHLALRARIVLCGAISTYNQDSDGSIRNYLNLVMTRSLMQGFLITDYAARFPEAMTALGAWAAKKQLHCEVDVQQGLENAPRTLQALFEGRNLGKQLLRLN